MREVLFRGKQIDSGEWVYGVPVPVIINCFSTNRIEMVKSHSYDELDYFQLLSDDEEVDPKTVGQYTGLTDKNGVKIFEGDIVLVNWLGHNGKFVVGYEGGSFFPYQIGCKFNFNSLWDVWFQDDDGTIMEVIGNIHDNPDLMTCHDNG